MRADLAQIHQVGEFSLVDQDGAVVTSADVAGKITVVSFFFSTCRELCPKLQSNLAKVQQAFRDDSSVVLLSHTVTPARDDTATLRRYAQANRIIRGKWHLLTGSVEQISRLARDGYFTQLPDSVSGAPMPVIHSETFALVDRQHRVRGVYDGSLMFDVERLIADIHALR